MKTVKKVYLGGTAILNSLLKTFNYLRSRI